MILENALKNHKKCEKLETLILYNSLYFLNAQIVGQCRSQFLQLRARRQQAMNDNFRGCTNVRHLLITISPLADIQTKLADVCVLKQIADLEVNKFIYVIKFPI